MDIILIGTRIPTRNKNLVFISFTMSTKQETTEALIKKLTYSTSFMKKALLEILDYKHDVKELKAVDRVYTMSITGKKKFVDVLTELTKFLRSAGSSYYGSTELAASIDSIVANEAEQDSIRCGVHPTATQSDCFQMCPRYTMALITCATKVDFDSVSRRMFEFANQLGPV